jgi:hypothetical protein
MAGFCCLLNGTADIRHRVKAVPTARALHTVSHALDRRVIVLLQRGLHSRERFVLVAQKKWNEGFEIGIYVDDDGVMWRHSQNLLMR